MECIKFAVPRIFPAFLLVLGIGLVITGIVLGDADAVFRKAVFICLECMGIG